MLRFLSFLCQCSFWFYILYLCLESKPHVLLNHLWTDLLFRKCRHEVECFSTTSFGNTDCWNMLGNTKGKCFWKNPFFSSVMGISVSQGCRLVSRCDHKTSRSLQCKHFTLVSLFLRKIVNFFGLLMSFSMYFFNCTYLLWYWISNCFPSCCMYESSYWFL